MLTDRDRGISGLLWHHTCYDSQKGHILACINHDPPTAQPSKSTLISYLKSDGVLKELYNFCLDTVWFKFQVQPEYPVKMELILSYIKEVPRSVSASIECFLDVRPGQVKSEAKEVLPRILPYGFTTAIPKIPKYDPLTGKEAEQYEEIEVEMDPSWFTVKI